MTKKEINSHPFVRWAKSKRIYSAWKRNLLEEEREALGYLPRVISGFFIWRETPEGHEYWERLDKEWQIEIGEEYES